MSDYEFYACPCGRNHLIGVECAIGQNVYGRKTAARIEHRKQFKKVYYPARLKRWQEKHPEEARKVNERFAKK